MRCLIARIIPVLLIIAYLTSGCVRNKNPVAPPNLRKLTWTVDTLSHPDNWQSALPDIWASSARDVYVAGWANTTHGILWHYDGGQWEEIKISATQGGPIFEPINFADVFGFGPEDVWLGGYWVESNPNPPPYSIHHSLLVHYDGSEWEQVPTPDDKHIATVWGPSPDNIWMAGVNGTSFHYDGVSVTRDSIPLDIPRDAGPYYVALSITGNETEACMLLVDNCSDINRYFFLENRGQGWVVKDSTFYYGSNKLWMSPSGTLYATGRSLYRRRNGVWEMFLYGQNTLTSFDVYGSSDDNLFAVGRSNTGHCQGVVYHYNGKDWFAYQELESQEYYYTEVWTDGLEVFITGRNGTDTIILHGK